MALKISHNDIKPSNILLVKNEEAEGADNINLNFVPKISDFGTSIQLEESNITIKGPD